MKKILILCLFLFGCDSFGVFSHGHEEGLCIITSVGGNFAGGFGRSCEEWRTEQTCMQDEVIIDTTYTTYNTWEATNLTCDEWEDIYWIDLNNGGICLTTSQPTSGGNALSQTCKDNITQEECLEDVPSDGEDYIVNNTWIITTQTCEEWNEHGLDID